LTGCIPTNLINYVPRPAARPRAASRHAQQTKTAACLPPRSHDEATTGTAARPHAAHRRTCRQHHACFDPSPSAPLLDSLRPLRPSPLSPPTPSRSGIAVCLASALRGPRLASPPAVCADGQRVLRRARLTSPRRTPCPREGALTRSSHIEHPDRARRPRLPSH